MSSDANLESGSFDSDVKIEQMPIEEHQRAASLTLRSDEAREARVVSMEAANKSLADALRITYRGLQLLMVALVVLFALSGFQQVNQAESGIRVVMGAIRSERLEPGFQFSPPRPFGEIIKVQTASRTLDLNTSFWPQLSPNQLNRPLDEISPSGPLKPGIDGSLLTADNNIAHAQFTVVYSVTDPVAFVRNLKVAAGSSASDRSDIERVLVRSAVERAAIRVIAEVPIDDLLKRGLSEKTQGGRENSLELRVRTLAQQTLDESVGEGGAGIDIGQVILRQVTPPLTVRREFNQVQIAQANASKARDTALGESSKILNTAAGSAHQPLVDLIDKYEQAIEVKDSQRQSELLDAIMGVLDGSYNTTPTRLHVDIAGQSYDNVRLSGAAAERISEAQRYRQTIAR